MESNQSSTKPTKKGKANGERKTQPESLAVAKRGVRTANDFAHLMGSLMGDLIEGSISAEVGNATCKAGANLLKVIELQQKYGSAQPVADRKVLELTTA